MITALCTLHEGDFHHGVAALANSLVATGFRGDLWAGFRGALPAWATSEPGAGGIAGVARHAAVRVVFVRLDTTMHFGCHKPDFIRRVLTELAPTADAAVYLDPDLVIEAPWSLLEPWIHSGLTLCEDVNSPLGDGHPWSTAWRDCCARRGLVIRRTPSWYANSGWVGVPRALAGFLDAWTGALALVGEEIGGLDRLKTADAFAPFNSVDQDACNLAVWLTDYPVQPMGRAAMAFGPGQPFFPHALGPDKPWRGGHLRRALRGRPPAYAHKAWLRCAGRDFRSMPAGRLGGLRRSLALAALIGRFYRRA